jgi:hypothetical protein
MPGHAALPGLADNQLRCSPLLRVPNSQITPYADLTQKYAADFIELPVWRFPARRILTGSRFAHR